VFLLVPADPGSPVQRAVKRLLLLCVVSMRAQPDALLNFHCVFMSNRHISEMALYTYAHSCWN